MNIKFLFSAVVTLGLLSSQGNAATNNVNTKAHVGAYNLILKGDLNTNSDIEGKAFIAGNLKMSGDILEVGTHLPASPKVDAVTVIGNIDANTVRVFNKNNIVYGGGINSTSFEGGIASKASTSVLQNDFDTIWAQAVNDSAYFETLSSTGTVSITQEGKKGTFENDNNVALNVFDIAPSTFLTNQNGVYDISAIPKTPIVINVSGTDINIKAGVQGNLANFASGQQVLWNFYEATSIQFNGGSWYGSILAPKADVTLAGGNINGGLLAKSLDASSELHNALYTYNPPSNPPTGEVPAPAGSLIIALGLTFMGYRKFKK